jgi:hypothetical protein
MAPPLQLLKTLSGSAPEDLLAEVEDVLRTMPSRELLRSPTPENLSWSGRAVTVISRWDGVHGVSARNYVGQILGTRGSFLGGADSGYTDLMTLLHEARADLRFSTVGPVNKAIDKGLVFDYFDEIRKQIEIAKTDLLFIDRYLDAEFISQYLPHVSSGVSVRLLARDRLKTLLPAARLFAQQNNVTIAIRSATNFHDRYMIVDGKACFQSGASFKDGGRTSPTTITQITDAFPAVQTTYEDLWQGAKVEL